MFSRTEEKSTADQPAAPTRLTQLLYDAEFEATLREENGYLLRFRNNESELITETDDRLQRYIMLAISKLQNSNPELNPETLSWQSCRQLEFLS